MPMSPHARGSSSAPHAAPSAPLTHAFHDLASMPDDLHAWVGSLAEDDVLDPTLALVLGVALQEWVANLVQHARWNHAPYVEITLDTSVDPLCCIVDDSSVGFALDQVLQERRQALSALPERGMGLLMLGSIADDLTYTPLGASKHRLRFCLRGGEPDGLDLTSPPPSV